MTSQLSTPLPTTARTILISGANQGLGLQIAKTLASLPDHHIFLGSRDLTKGRAAAASIGTPNITPVELDITSDDSVAACVASVAAQTGGRLDVLVNNAGCMTDRPGSHAPGTSLRELMATVLGTNVVGTAALTEACVPLLRAAAPGARVVSMSSALGSLTLTADEGFAYYGAWLPAYKASKAAINMLMRTFAVRFRDEGIAFVAVCPGAVSTGMNDHREGLATLEEGVREPVRLITEKVVQTGTFTNAEGAIAW